MEERNLRKTRVGVVVSDKMDKTIVVAVKDSVQHLSLIHIFEYDPNRSAFIALVEYTDGVKSYIIAPDGLKVGDVVISSKSADIKPGNCLPFENIPVGTIIHNIELYPGRGAQLVQMCIRDRSGDGRRCGSGCMHG